MRIWPFIKKKNFAKCIENLPNDVQNVIQRLNKLYLNSAKTLSGKISPYLVTRLVGLKSKSFNPLFSKPFKLTDHRDTKMLSTQSFAFFIFGKKSVATKTYSHFSAFLSPTFSLNLKSLDWQKSEERRLRFESNQE